MTAASVLVGLTALLLNGASSSRATVAKPDEFAIVNLEPDRGGSTLALTSEKFSLSTSAPLNREQGVEFLLVERDGTTQIRALSTRRVLTAKPGSAFASEEFGSKGLVLESADTPSQTAKLVRWQCTRVAE